MLPVAHVEEAGTEQDDYERKSGCFLSSNDTPEVRQVRFGNLREIQKEILNRIEEDDNGSCRQIFTFYDPSGNHGKSWFTLHMFERGNLFPVPRSDATAGKLSAFICSAYNWERYIAIDLPRASTTNRELYECLEDTKDGLVFDHRYKGKIRNIRGPKLILFTNNPINPDLLSWDRIRDTMYRYDQYSERWSKISINQMREIYQYTNKKKTKSKKKDE